MISFHNLSEAVRKHMVEEIMADVATDTIFLSPRLTDTGRVDYPILLHEAAIKYDPAWLADQVNTRGMIKDMEERKGRPVKVPYTAAQTMAEGDFNRYYIRGVCLAVLGGNPEAEVEVYRAKAVEDPRPASQAWVGRRVKAGRLLADLLAHKQDLSTALGIPGGPNSGLSVRIPAA